MQIGDTFKNWQGEIFTIVEVLSGDKVKIMVNYKPSSDCWTEEGDIRITHKPTLNQHAWTPYTGPTKFNFKIGQITRIKNREFIISKLNSLGFSSDDIIKLDTQFTSIYNLEVEVMQLRRPDRDLWVCKLPNGLDFPLAGWMLAEAKSGTFKQIYGILNSKND
jgi:hypothetical protein